jgi:hypothetical protein
LAQALPICAEGGQSGFISRNFFLGTATANSRNFRGTPRLGKNNSKRTDKFGLFRLGHFQQFSFKAAGVPNESSSSNSGDRHVDEPT